MLWERTIEIYSQFGGPCRPAVRVQKPVRTQYGRHYVWAFFFRDPEREVLMDGGHHQPERDVRE